MVSGQGGRVRTMAQGPREQPSCLPRGGRQPESARVREGCRRWGESNRGGCRRPPRFGFKTESAVGGAGSAETPAVTGLSATWDGGGRSGRPVNQNAPAFPRGRRKLPVRNRFEPSNPALTHHVGLVLLVNRLGAIKNAVGGSSAFGAGLGPRRMPPAELPARGVQILHPALSTR